MVVICGVYVYLQSLLCTGVVLSQGILIWYRKNGVNEPDYEWQSKCANV